MRRRSFFVGLVGTMVGLPLATRAQRSAMPVIGFVNAGSAQGLGLGQLQAYLKGLRETGNIEGQNVSIEYHWADEVIE